MNFGLSRQERLGQFLCTCILMYKRKMIKVVTISCRGCVVTMECVEKLIRKDMLDPINGKHMKDKDIIQLERVRKYGPQHEKTCLWSF